VRGGRVTFAAVFAVFCGLFFAAGALACSCAPSAPSKALSSSDAAIVGRLLGVTTHGATQAKYRYQVLRVYRGRGPIERGAKLTVLSPRGSAACALPDRVGRSYGLFLLSDRGRWASGLCGVISPRRLWSAARKPGSGHASAPAAAASCTS
jgi:hypothetical protein